MFQIRDANLADIPDLVEIYNSEVASSHTNYESQEIRVDERESWLKNLQEKKYPVLVSTQSDGKVVGYAALTPFHPLTGYRFTATGSVYVRANFRRSGVGRELLAVLKVRAIQQGIHSVIAGVNSENTASLELLKSIGFKEVGQFKEIGYKNGSWHDDTCLQLLL